jgi:putative transposase
MVTILPKRINSTRMPDWDYAGRGTYFISICVAERRCVLSEVVDAKVRLLKPGMVVACEWARLETLWPCVKLDRRVVMPDHFQALLSVHPGPESGRLSCHLGTVVAEFKAACTRRIREGGLANFAWQRGFHDRVVRDQVTLQQIRDYIAHNPREWSSRTTP